MMKNDIISRQAAIDALETVKSCLVEEEHQFLDCLISDMKKLPSAQTEIIRCKDCKYARLTHDGSCKYCDIWFPDEAEYMDGDYYCASAERKSNG